MFNASMGVWAPHDLAVQHAGKLQIVAVNRPAGHLIGAVVTDGPRADHLVRLRDGIRGQIQLLVNYADANSRAANLHHPVSPYIWRSDAAFDTYFAKGWAPTWSDMGHGNWATDPAYAGKVIAVYRSMVAFTQR